MLEYTRKQLEDFLLSGKETAIIDLGNRKKYTITRGYQPIKPSKKPPLNK